MFGLKVTNLRRMEEDVLQYEEKPVEKGLIMFYGCSRKPRLWRINY